MVTSCPLSASLQVIDQQVRELCSFTKDQPFTIKWIDEEHDPIVISSEMELKEAFRLHELNKEWQLTVHGKFLLCTFLNSILTIVWVSLHNIW